MIRFLYIIFLVLTVSSAYSQKETVQFGKVVNGDTIPVVQLPSLDHVAKRTWKSRREQRKYSRLKRKVKKVYPYAHLAGQKLDQYGAQMDTITSPREKKKFYKKIEQELRAEYEGELKKLTISEGRILIKLIDRETGDSSYALVKDLRGKFSAFFWQSLARLFGHNLKSKYDPTGEDKEIEFIVQQIERGYI